MLKPRSSKRLGSSSKYQVAEASASVYHWSETEQDSAVISVHDKINDIESDEYWEEKKRRHQVIVPPGATHHFTKHFDPDNGMFYYYDHVTGQSTWDKPPGPIELHMSDEQIETMKVAKREELAKKRDDNDRRQRVLEELRKEKAAALELLRNEKAEAESKKLNTQWQTAMIEATMKNGELELCWEHLGFISPLIYKFYDSFGMHLRALRLVGMSLRSLPEEVGDQLYMLEVLHLANNELTTLPDNIIKLTNLRDLNLLKNRLVSLPTKIGLLCSLKLLELANNCLEYLPVTFGALNKLERLVLESNRLKVLPENLDNMTACRYLNVSNNQLTRLPKCLARMPNLTVLSACKNKISYVPSNLAESKTLRAIRLSANQINQIPDNIGDLTKLRELSLDFNRIARLPLPMYRLDKLKVLRIEGNEPLCDPPAEIIAKGAEAVVEYFKQKLTELEERRIRTIVYSMQDALTQVQERNLADPAMFEPSWHIEGENELDDWFAFQMPYFWSDLVTALRNAWTVEEQEDDDGINMKRIRSFPYTEREVMYAFLNYTDAYGQLLRKEYAYFRRCGCVDENGRRKPCIPPKVGYMCKRVCTLVKARSVLEHDRQDRLWEEYKKNNIADAVKRSRYEAEQWLNTIEGKDWLETLSYEQAEEVFEEQGLGKKIDTWRKRVANRRKKKIIRRIDRQKAKIQKIKDKKSVEIEADLAKLRDKLKTVDGGYVKTAIEGQILNLTMRLACMDEAVQLQRLALKCQEECDKIDDDLFDGGLEEYEALQRKMEEQDTSDSEINDENEEEKEKDDDEDGSQAPHEHPDMIERHARKAKRAEMELEIEATSRAAKKFARTTDQDKTQIPKERRNPIEIIADGVEDTYKVILRNSIPLPRFAKRALKKRLRLVRDVVDVRVRKLMMNAKGDIDEIQKEMKHELYHQYLSFHVSEAKEEAQKNLRIIDNVRENLRGLGKKTCFLAWKEWVQTRKERERRDRELKWFSDINKFETAMESVHIAEFQVSQWKKQKDIFTDKTYWKHVITGKITTEEPGIQHYLPTNFKIPAPPEKPVEIDSDDGKDGDIEKKGVEQIEGVATDVTQMVLKDPLASKKPIEISSDDDDDDLLDDDDDFDDEDLLLEGEEELENDGGDDGSSVYSNDVEEYEDEEQIPLLSGEVRPASKSTDGAAGEQKDGVDTGALVVAAGGGGEAVVERRQSMHRSRRSMRGSMRKAVSRANSRPSSSIRPRSKSPHLPRIKSVARKRDATTAAAEGSGALVPLPAEQLQPSEFTYGPDYLRAKTKKEAAGGFYSKMTRAFFQEPPEPQKQLTEFHKQYHAAVDFKKSDDYQNNTQVLVLPDINRTDLDSVRESLKERQASEFMIASKQIRQIRNKSDVVRHNTYVNGRSRKPRSLEAIIEARKEAEEKERQLRMEKGELKEEWHPPAEDQLLLLAGGEKDMVWKSQEDHMKLRTVLALKALDAKAQAEKIAAKKGLIKPKQKSVWSTSIAPLWRQNYISSSDSDQDDTDVVERKKIIKRAKSRQKGERAAGEMVDSDEEELEQKQLRRAEKREQERQGRKEKRREDREEKAKLDEKIISKFREMYPHDELPGLDEK